MTSSNLCRRSFLSAAAMAVASTAASGQASQQPQLPSMPEPGRFPVKSVSSANGLEATKRAYQLITSGKDTLEAVVAGVEIVENDPADVSVGYGGLPNEDGVVELDAAVMHGPRHRAGSVASLRGIRNPAQVALKVMNHTDHELLVGEGALRFARAFGFQEENLLTEKARKIWLHWKQTMSDKDDWLANVPESVDADTAEFFRQHSERTQVAGQSRLRFRRPTGTIHCAAMNTRGDISCTTTTSGLAFKIPGPRGRLADHRRRPLRRQRNRLLRQHGTRGNQPAESLQFCSGRTDASPNDSERSGSGNLPTHRPAHETQRSPGRAG